MELGIFQVLVRRWCVRTFGQQVADDRRERVHRFLEEALELGQALGGTRADAHALVDYVYGRPAGNAGQEVGGVMVTLAALCGAHQQLSMDMESKLELSRINRPDVAERIRRKQAAKQRDIPLPPPGTVLDARTHEWSGIHKPECASKDFRPGKGFDACDCEPRTQLDAVGTTGGKATTSKLT